MAKGRISGFRRPVGASSFNRSAFSVSLRTRSRPGGELGLRTSSIGMGMAIPILADEPTSSLDWRTAFLELLERECAEQAIYQNWISDSDPRVDASFVNSSRTACSFER